MPRVYTLHGAFNSGELTPRLFGNVGIDQYANAVQTMENFLIEKRGPAEYRPGTRYVADAKSNTDDVILQPFELSTDAAYILEFGPLYIRFYTSQSQVSGPLEVVTPYLEAELRELRFTQTADKLYIAHTNHPLKVLTSTNPTTWSLDDHVYTDGPYKDVNKDETLIMGLTGGTPGPQTMTASGAGHTPFVSTDVGRTIRVGQNSTNDWGYCTVTGYTSSTVVSVNIVVNIPSVSTYKWRFDAYNQVDLYPAVVATHQQRLWIGGGAGDNSDRIYSSESLDFDAWKPSEYDGEVIDSNAITYPISAGNRTSKVVWLRAGRVLFVGASGAELQVDAGVDKALTPSSASIDKISQYGTEADIDAISMSNTVAFIQRQGLKLRQLTFKSEVDTLYAPDLTLLAEHLTSSPIRDVAWQEEPATTLWAARTDGTLIAFTHEAEEGVAGWSKHTLGGTDAKVISVAAVSSDVDARDELWMIVERTVNSATVRYVEILEARSDHATDKEDAFHVDSGITYSGSSTTTITGLSHLEGEVVTVLGDGAVQPTQTVSSGQITLPLAVEKAQVGLGYTGVLQLLPPAFQLDQVDQAQLRKQRSYQLSVRMYRSLGLKAGPSTSDLVTVPFRDSSMPMDSSPPLFSGVKQIPISKSWNLGDGPVLVQDQPLPCIITTVVQRMNITDA